MRSMIAIIAIASLTAGGAFAQYGAKQPPEPPITQTKPATPSTPSTSAAAITEAQAKARFEAQGYGNISQVRKDAQGVWTANAMKDGKSHQLSLDARGQVTQRN